MKSKSTTGGLELKGATCFPFSFLVTPQQHLETYGREPSSATFLVISLQSSSPVSSETAAPVAPLNLSQGGVSLCVASVDGAWHVVSAAGVLAGTWLFYEYGRLLGGGPSNLPASLEGSVAPPFC